MDNSSLIALVLLLCLVPAVAFYVMIWPGIRRRRIQSRPFPDAWLTTLRRQLPCYDSLSEAEQRRLRELVQLFIENKHFVGCAGQEIDDEIRVTIASQACLLVLKKSVEPYSSLRSVLVYPSTFIAERDEPDEIGLVSNTRRHLLGESWEQGKVILAWDNVQHGVSDPEDGENVVFHEFAHQLDSESGITNGAPVLLESGAYEDWSEVLRREYELLCHKAETAEASLLDHYGAIDPAEFFAVITETFFERPTELVEEHPDLYAQLKAFYGLDPAGWAEAR